MERTTTTGQIVQRLVEVLVSRGVQRQAIAPQATWEQLGADSLDLVRTLEHQYGVQTRREELTEIRTVGQAIDFVTARVAGLSRQHVFLGPPTSKGR